MGDQWVAVRYFSGVSIQQPIPRSFLVRVYRIDPQAPDKIAGQVEAIDGSGERASFTDIGELARTLKNSVKKGNATGKLRGK